MKSVNAEKGWGHISCDATNKIYGKDMFIMKTQLDASGCVAEQTVCFTVSGSGLRVCHTAMRAWIGRKHRAGCKVLACSVHRTQRGQRRAEPPLRLVAFGVKGHSGSQGTPCRQRQSD
jgi:hypothetical protein